MNNPMQILQAMKNPQQFIQNIFGNNQVMNNPIIKNAAGMYKSNDQKGLEKMARNICKEKGINPDDLIKQFGMM